jgi:serine/threonine protein kinase/tetratricopeptide (TPR) repeat protein
VFSGTVPFPDRVRLGEDFELDRRAYELRRAGRALRLERIPMDLLVLLVERRGDLVTRDQIIEKIWGKDVFLDTDGSINSAIRKIRQVLRDDPERPRFVQTVSGRGYRFIAPVEEFSPPILQTAGAPTPAENPLGKKISHYRILGMLGGGGMGVVYKAEDLKLGRLVALKFLPSELASDPLALERLQREARAASALDHPNICSIYQLGEHEGQPFIVMQLLEGQTLREWIEAVATQDTATRVNSLVELAMQITDGLEAAHDKEIIHRDIKPANVFITSRGQVKLLDFGVAKFLDAVELPGAQSEADETAGEGGFKATVDSHLTRTGVSVGTPSYLSPEQIRGERLDARTDLFSCGLILYEMATGQRVFSGDTAAVIRDAVLNLPAVPVRQVNREIPEDLERIISRALEKDRNTRYQNAAEIRVDLQQLKASLTRPSITERSPKTTGTSRTTRRKIGWILVPAFVALVAALISGVFYHRSRQKAQVTDKDTIVLADFANSTGDAVFDETLKTALNVSLRQSPFLNVLSDSDVARTLQQMTRGAGTRLTPDVAHELCQRAGIKAYLAGSIGNLGSEYVLGLKAVNCQSGDTLAEEQVTAASKEKVLDALGKAASQLRAELGESLATVQKFDVPLARATTSSLEALRAYSLGWKAAREKGAAAALPLNLRAIELDPNFAMGYRAVGRHYLALGENGRASEYFTKAFQLRAHASEREELAITADYYETVTGEMDKGVQVHQELIENYPREAGPYARLGRMLAFQGQYEKARETTTRALHFGSPDDVYLYSNLAKYALALQRFDQARQMISEAQARNLDGDIDHLFLYALAFLAADSSAMSEQQQWFAGKPEYENFGLAYASDTEAYDGHLGRAQELTRRAVDSAIRADNKESGAIYLANAALEQAAYGNAAGARRSATDALKIAPANLGAAVEAALAFSMAGDTARAESLAQNLGKRFPLNNQMQLLWLPAIRAQLALREKNPTSALNALKPASPLELGETPFGNNISCLYPVYIRGEAYLAAGQGAAAAAEFQRILEHSGIVWNCWTGALAHLGVARANALQANTSQGAVADAARVRALAAYRQFLTIWKDADPDIPILKQAKAEYAKVQ